MENKSVKVQLCWLSGRQSTSVGPEKAAPGCLGDTFVRKITSIQVTSWQTIDDIIPLGVFFWPARSNTHTLTSALCVYIIAVTLNQKVKVANARLQRRHLAVWRYNRTGYKILNRHKSFIHARIILIYFNESGVKLSHLHQKKFVKYVFVVKRPEFYAPDIAFVLLSVDSRSSRGSRDIYLLMGFKIGI